MKEIFTELYNDMLAEIECCSELDLPDKEKAEKCFWISRNYAMKLKGLITDREFNDENEEIDFFRNVKPQFVYHIEYFMRVSEAISIVPGKSDAAIAFWEEEKSRFEEFRQNHESFISYYESGQDDLDVTYFLRENNDLSFMPNLQIYDSDIEWCTSHDRLVRNYIAYKKYEEYCRKKISELI